MSNQLLDGWHYAGSFCKAISCVLRNVVPGISCPIKQDNLLEGSKNSHSNKKPKTTKIFTHKDYLSEPWFIHTMGNYAAL